MAAVREKQVGPLLSWSAIGLGTALTLWLFLSGLREPREFGMMMAVSHHTGGYGYGTPISCHDCHVPDSGGAALFTRMDCFTGGCHLDLRPDTPHDRAIAYFRQGKEHLPDIDDRTEYVLGLHGAAQTMACWDCHREHKPYKPALPTGWQSYGEWRSTREVSATSAQP